MEIYRFLLDLLPSTHSIRMTIVNALNRLANKCSISLDERYKPSAHLSSRDYSKGSSQISAFDVDEALNFITHAENQLHRKNVKENLFEEEKNQIDSFFFSSTVVNKRWIYSKNDRSFRVPMPIVFSFDPICTIYNRKSFWTTVRSTMNFFTNERTNNSI